MRWASCGSSSEPVASSWPRRPATETLVSGVVQPWRLHRRVPTVEREVGALRFLRTCLLRGLTIIVVAGTACEPAPGPAEPSTPAPATVTTPPSPSPAAGPFAGIWPVETAEEAVSKQLLVDAGRALWLLEPARVGASYARSVLGWRFPRVRATGEQTLVVSDPGSGAVLRVQMTQPLAEGEGGIWVVTAADTVSDGNLPKAVVETRNAILEATVATDYGLLRPLIDTKTFVHSFGGGEDPIAYWKEREADGGEKPLEVMASILSMPCAGLRTDLGAYYVWPAVYAHGPFSLTPEETKMLSAVYPDIDHQIASWKAFGGYIGWRLGIKRDGTWAFFVAGD